MTNYLVTGGLGFIGSHLAAALLDDPDAHVTIIDNLQNQVFSVEDIVTQIAGPRPGQLEVQTVAVADFAPDKRFDAIYHLASIVGPAAVLNYAGFITEGIVQDTYVVIRLAQEQRARLVNVSTSEVYGGGERGYCEEDTPRIIKGSASARQEYAVAKLACEVAIENLCRQDKLDAVIVRPFNVSGVRQLGRGGFVLPRFVGQALLGLPLTVFGDGTQVRAFTDVHDVANGIRLVGHKGQQGTVYNVGNPANRTTIRDLAELVVRVSGSKSPIKFIDPRRIYGSRYEEAADKFPNASRLTALGWEPRWRLSETVDSVCQSFRQMPLALMRRVAGLDESGQLLSVVDGEVTKVVDGEATKVGSPAVDVMAV